MKRKRKIKVPLSLIVNAIEMASDEWNQYLDIEKMEVVSLPEYPFASEYDEEEQELADLIDAEWNVRFFGLPSKYDIHEYSIMEDFIWSLPEGHMQDVLENAIRGKGAFRRFRDSIIRYGVEQDWYDFQIEAYRKLAVEWCENRKFVCVDDRKTAKEDPAAHPEKEKKNREGKDPTGKDPLAWEEIHTEHLILDEWIDFRRTSYRFPDGSVYEPFYSYSRRDYVVIVASDTNGKYLCVRQFRQGIRQVTTEFPAGCIEQKDSKSRGDNRSGRNKKGNKGQKDRKGNTAFGFSGNLTAEDALEAARRELFEETGYRSDEWQALLTVPSNATLADNYAHLFVARNCRRVSGQALDEMEFVDVKKYSARQIEELIEKGEFQQAVHITAWLLSQRNT